MASYTGPSTVTSNLIFAIDAANPMSVLPTGASKVLNARQLVRNLVDRSQSITTDPNLYLTGQTYYTAVAIDYPEGSLGGPLANRHGLTPGFYNLSAGKIYDSSRSLHMWVWNNDTSSWIPDLYFSGFRLSGHCYDTYSGSDAPGGYAAELVKFAANFNAINTIFPNCTYIITGSHRDSYRDSTVRSILYKLGLPGGTPLDNDALGSPEWILAGDPSKPALNPLAWVFENNDGNSAVAVIGLGSSSPSTNSIAFDGTSNYIQTGITGTYSQISFDFWSFFDDPALSMTARDESILGDWNNGRIHFGTRWSVGMHWNVNSMWEQTPGTNVKYGWNHYTLVWNHGTSEKKVYINSILSSSHTTNGNIVLGDFKIGVATALNMYYRGRVGKFAVYDRALTAAEVQQNFNATRSRYGI